ncbi:MAG: hypothetical protein QM478_11635 [Flavobacteriaceae bacterium]
MKNRPELYKVERNEKKHFFSNTELKTLQNILKSDLNFNIEFAMTIVTKIRDYKINS